MRKFHVALLAAGLTVVAPIVAFALSAPTYAPTYIPTGLQAAATLSAAGTIATPTTGDGCLAADVSGTNTGIVATFQVTPDGPSVASPVWKSVAVLPQGIGNSPAGKIANVTGDGIYRLKTDGYAQVRFNLTAISTGSVNVNYSGTNGDCRVDVDLERRVTYSAAKTGLTTAASATDIFTIVGSATTTVRVTHVACSGIATTEGIADLQLIVRSAADTGGTSTSPADVPNDANDPAGTAVVSAYTANPSSLGTAVGTVRTGKLILPLAASSVTTPQVLAWDFDRDLAEEPITLRGVAQTLAVNGNAATLASGAVVDCEVEWTEE
jgi:hypothetical protein